MTGTVVISLDAELSWGQHDRTAVPPERVSATRNAWIDLLKLFDTYRIPTTWGVVGHLFLEECSGTHAEHPAGNAWFARDPGGVAADDSGWFGRDLIAAILESEVDHEIASHSFSHVEFGDPNTSREIADAELNHSLRAAKQLGVNLRSFVFPRNNVGHRGALAANGFICYRGTAPERWYMRPMTRRVGKFATFALAATAPPIVKPTVDEHGLVNVPASMYLFTFEGPISDAIATVVGDPVVRQVRLGLDRVVEDGEGLLHLWLHPYNVTTPRERARMTEILSLIANRRDRDEIVVKTMGEVAEETLEMSPAVDSTDSRAGDGDEANAPTGAETKDVNADDVDAETKDVNADDVDAETKDTVAIGMCHTALPGGREDRISGKTGREDETRGEGFGSAEGILAEVIADAKGEPDG